MNNDTIHLIVGCGKAGVATMAAQIRSRLYSRGGLKEGLYCYLAVDSNWETLDCFDKIMGRLPGGRATCSVRTILLSCRDHDSFGSFVRHSFAIPFLNGNNADGLKRLKEHWWYDADGRPYGENRHEPERAIDFYGLTWSYLPKIGTTVDELVEEALRRSWSGSQEVDVHVIASLAEETGRGAWGLVALKVRECLEERGISTRPVAVLYDASICRNEYRYHLQNDLRLKVNALTGISELSCWMGNERRNPPLSYRLPNLRSPTQRACDDLRVVGDGDSPSTEGPFSELQLITERHGLGSPLDHFKEIGRVLHLRLASDADSFGFINSNRSFSSGRIGSCGSATFEVDIGGIEEFCHREACNIAIERFLQNADDVSPDVEQFFSSIPANDSVRGLDGIRPVRGGTLFQRLAAVLVKRAGATFEGFLTSLPAEGTARAKERLGLVVEALPESEIREAMAEVLSGLGMDDGPEGVRDIVRRSAMRVFSGRPDQRPSLGRVRDFLAQLTGGLLKFRAFPETVSPPEPATDAVTRFGKRTFVEALLFRPRFNDAEISVLLRRKGETFSGIVVDQFLVENYGGMKRVVGEFVDRVLGEVERLLARVAGIADGLVKESERSAHDEEVTWTKLWSAVSSLETGRSSTEDSFQGLFVTPDRLMDAIHEELEELAASQRILKPIVESREWLRHIIGDAIHLGDHHGWRAVENPALLEEDDDEFLSAHVRKLVRSIRNSVRLEVGFFEEHFSFLAVLERNRVFWNEELKRQEEDASRWGYMFMSDCFLGTLGVEPIIDPDGGHRKLPPVEDIKYTIIGPLAGRSRTGWELDRSVRSEVSMTVHVPFKKDYDWEEQLSANERSHGEIRFEMLDLTNPASSLYSYSSILHETIVPPGDYSLPVWRPADKPEPENHHAVREQKSQEPVFPFDFIRSLKYYREPDIREKLIEAERKDGKPIFDKDEFLGGLGYLSPFHVRNDEVSKTRWKPWSPGGDGPEKPARG